MRYLDSPMQEVGHWRQHLVIFQQAHDLFQARDVPVVAVNEVDQVLCFLCGLGFALAGTPLHTVPCLKVSLQTCTILKMMPVKCL